jgi:hypothetical protein
MHNPLICLEFCGSAALGHEPHHPGKGSRVCARGCKSNTSPCDSSQEMSVNCCNLAKHESWIKSFNIRPPHASA